MSGSTMPMPGAAGGTDPSAGAAPDTDEGSDVVVTICSNGDGSYTVYAGDEPEGGESGDMSEDDDDGAGGGGMAGGDASSGTVGGGGAGAAGPQGQPASSIGEALKITMTILQGDESSQGGAGSPDDQLSAGFGASKAPTLAGSQKY